MRNQDRPQARVLARRVAPKRRRNSFGLKPSFRSPGPGRRPRRACSRRRRVGRIRSAADPGAFSSTPVSAAFQAQDCDKLGFKPKLFLRLFGATRRAKNPRLRAVLIPHAGDANFARAATILPRSLILDQSNLSKVCTRVQFAAGQCPKNSIYGTARAFSPLLAKPLEGPVYLRSSDNPLPDLVADLHGQVDVELDSRTDSVHGHIRNTFDATPDVPVSKLILTLRGGKKGLLVNSRNQCTRKKQRAIVRLKAQNGKKLNLRPRLRAPCHKKHRHGK